MRPINQKMLKEAIRHLPSFKAPDGLWEELEQKLKLQHPLNDLPGYTAPEDAWEKIERELDKEITLKRKNTIRLVIRTSAAVILLLLSLYSTKVIIGDKAQGKLHRLKTEIPDVNNLEERGFESIYNPALCQSNPHVCSTPLFKSLDNELQVIKAEIIEMKPMVKGGDPQLLKYYYRLVNEHIEIEKRLVKLIMQT
jgi:hypothetical protein